MAMFKPDDDRDPDDSDSGYESMDDYLNERGDDMEYPSSTGDVQTDRVDVDPDLFGEFPSGPIDESVENNDASQRERTVVLIRLTGTCPFCDEEVDIHPVRDVQGNEIDDINCSGCGRQWASKPQ